MFIAVLRNRIAPLILGIGLFACAEDPSTEFPLERRFVDGALVSTARPEAAFRASGEFDYIGGFAFPLKGLARVERHVWAATGESDGRPEIERLIVVQFEEALEGQDIIYQFSIPPAEEASGGDFLFSPERVTLGRGAYVHNSWAFDQGRSARNDPGAESARLLAFLAERGLALEDELIMSRMVREVGADGRAEIILFYMEPLSAHGYSLADFPPDAPVSEAFAALSELMLDRHLASLAIED